MAIVPEKTGNIEIRTTNSEHINKKEKAVEIKERKLEKHEYLMIEAAELLIMGMVGLGLGLIIYGLIKINYSSIALGLILFFPVAYASYMEMIIILVPEKNIYMVSAFKKFYKALGPGFHIIVPLIMQIDRKLTINASKTFDIYLREGSDRLEFIGGSVGLKAKVVCRAMNAYGVGYEINITNEEIDAIEQLEKDKGLHKLPENWMYITAVIVEAAVRGVAGKYTIDEAIAATVIGEKNEKGEIKRSIILEAINEANNNLDQYGIEVEQLAFSAIDLGPDLEKALNKIQIEKKGVEVKEQKLRQAVIDAKIGEQEGLKVKNRLDAIASDEQSTEEYEEGGRKKKRVVGKKPSGLTRADVMKWEAAMKTAESVDNISVLTGGKDEPIPLEVAARMGAAFKTGSDAVQRKEKKSKEKTEPEEETEEKSNIDEQKEETEEESAEKIKPRSVKSKRKRGY